MNRTEIWNDGDRVINQHTKKLGRVELRAGMLFIHTDHGLQTGSQKMLMLTGWTKLYEVE